MRTEQADALISEIEDLVERMKSLRERVWGAVDPHGREEMVRSCASKKRYPTPDRAGAAAKSAHDKGSTDELRVYPCAICDGFHLTHVPLERFVERRGP